MLRAKSLAADKCRIFHLRENVQHLILETEIQSGLCRQMQAIQIVQISNIEKRHQAGPDCVCRFALNVGLSRWGWRPVQKTKRSAADANCESIRKNTGCRQLANVEVDARL